MYKLKLKYAILYKGKTFFLAFTIMFLYYSQTYSQNKKEPLIIEIDNTTYDEEIPTISNILEQQLSGNIPAYVSNSINTKSIVGLCFSVDSLFTINSSFSENMPPLLKNEILSIFQKMSELKSMIFHIKENRIILNKVYIIPIIFHFRYTSNDESIPTFKRDYVSLDKFLKSMKWENTEMMDFIMIDMRNRNH